MAFLDTHNVKFITHSVYTCVCLCVRANALWSSNAWACLQLNASKPLEAFDACNAFIHLETQMRLCTNAFPYAFKPNPHSERTAAYVELGPVSMCLSFSFSVDNLCTILFCFIFSDSLSLSLPLNT